MTSLIVRKFLKGVTLVFGSFPNLGYPGDIQNDPDRISFLRVDFFFLKFGEVSFRADTDPVLSVVTFLFSKIAGESFVYKY